MFMKEELIIEEEKRLRRLRWVVDLTAAVLMQSDLTLHESLALMNDAKRAALNLFPDKEFVYDLVYTPRFERILNERFGSNGGYPARN